MSKVLPRALSTDELFETAVKLISGYEEIRPSILQRYLKIGYARARRIIDLLEEKGYIVSKKENYSWKVLKK